MAIVVKQITLWRAEVQNQPGILAGILEAPARADANLKVVMAYRQPGQSERAAIELYAITGKRMAAAAEAAGLSPSTIPTLLVEGDDYPGLAHAITRAVADTGINIAFFVAHAIGRKYAGVMGFETTADAWKAARVIRKTAARNATGDAI